MPEDQQNGEITSYSILVEGPGTTRNITTISDWMPPVYRPHSIVEDAYTSEEVSDLKPSTKYTFSVSAVTVAGSGPAISVTFITPQEGEVSVYTNFLIIASASMTWCGGVLSITLNIQYFTFLTSMFDITIMG